MSAWPFANRRSGLFSRGYKAAADSEPESQTHDETMSVKQSEGRRPRRDFLSTILGLWSALTLIPLVNVVLRYVTPLKSSTALKQSLLVGPSDEIALNAARIVRFNKEPVIIVHTESGQFKAFFARCTHLGCVVKFESEGTPRLHCNCHGSEFDLTGKNLSGPAPRPLTPLKVTIQEASLIISTTEA